LLLGTGYKLSYLVTYLLTDVVDIQSKECLMHSGLVHLCMMCVLENASSDL